MEKASTRILAVWSAATGECVRQSQATLDWKRVCARYAFYVCKMQEIRSQEEVDR